MYKVIGNTRTRTLRVLWTLEELGLEYEHVSAPPRDPSVIAVNPAGKVPVLIAEGVPITDSLAIMTYLADRHAALTFAPGTIDRAHQDALTHFINEEFDQILWMAARHSFVLPEEHRLPAIKDSLKWEFEQSQQRLLPRMSETGPFLMGDTMTIADILLAHCLNWASNANFTIPTQALLDYRKRMNRRPAFLRVMALEAPAG